MNRIIGQESGYEETANEDLGKEIARVKAEYRTLLGQIKSRQTITDGVVQQQFAEYRSAVHEAEKLRTELEVKQSEVDHL